MQIAFMYGYLMSLHIGKSVMLIVVMGSSGATEHENGIHYVCVSERHVLLFKCWPFFDHRRHSDGLTKDCSIPLANKLVILHFCIKLSTWIRYDMSWSTTGSVCVEVVCSAISFFVATIYWVIKIIFEAES